MKLNKQMIKDIKLNVNGKQLFERPVYQDVAKSSRRAEWHHTHLAFLYNKELDAKIDLISEIAQSMSEGRHIIRNVLTHFIESRIRFNEKCDQLQTKCERLKVVFILIIKVGHRISHLFIFTEILKMKEAITIQELLPM